MKYFVVTDSTDTQVGLRLAGIEGVVVREEPEVREAIRSAVANPEIGVLLITEHLAALCSDLLAPVKMTSHIPLVVEIPDRRSQGRASDSITRYIREAIGVKL
ncbi:MAG: ATP synthase subunit F [Clostridia bacterium]|nr:ATP synthase subunit F [Clostridia bacterium]